jgi:hypothetical protein
MRVFEQGEDPGECVPNIDNDDYGGGEFAI